MEFLGELRVRNGFEKQGRIYLRYFTESFQTMLLNLKIKNKTLSLHNLAEMFLPELSSHQPVLLKSVTTQQVVKIVSTNCNQDCWLLLSYCSDEAAWPKSSGGMEAK